MKFLSCPKFLLVLLLVFVSIAVADSTDKKIVISDQVGDEIDKAEKEFYNLFSAFPDFNKAALFQTIDGQYFFLVEYYDENKELQTRNILRTEQQINQLRSYFKEFGKQSTQGVTNIRKSKDRLDVGYCSLSSRAGLFAFEVQDNIWGMGIKTFYQNNSEIDDIVIFFNLSAALPTSTIVEPYVSAGIGTWWFYIFPIFNVGVGAKIKIYKGIFARCEYSSIGVKNNSAYGFNLGIGYSFKRK